MGVNRKRQEQIDSFLTKDVLEKLFKDGYSANYIAKKYFAPDFVTHACTVIKIARKFGIKTHSMKESGLLDMVKAQKAATNIELFGFANISQSQAIKDKKINSALEKYGVINVFQAEEIKARSRETNLKKYGAEYPRSLSVKCSKVSKFQKDIYSRILELGVAAELEIPNKFSKFNDNLSKIYSPIVDILLLDFPIIVECNGDHYHANPDRYKPNDIIIKFKGPAFAKDIWEFDRIRQEHIESFGYIVINIWESEHISNRQLIGVKVNEAIENYKNSKN